MNLAEIEKKIAQLQAQKKEVIAKNKAKERKERTRRLIQIGALVEKYSCEITDLAALEIYLSKYGYAIRNSQPSPQLEEIESEQDTNR